jgi:predicted branched-subunit amino acid permease
MPLDAPSREPDPPIGGLPGRLLNRLPRLNAWWARRVPDPALRHWAQEGMRDLGPLVPGIAAWGVVTGVAMVKGGLGIVGALAMSLLVFAGSSQLAALPLIAAGAPIWVIWLTALVVNLRFIIFSAQWRLYFGGLPRWRRSALVYLGADANYAVFVRRWPAAEPQPAQVPYFLGGALMLWGVWQVASIAGILLAGSVPLAWGLGFAGVLALLGLTCSLLVDRATWVCGAVAGLAALAAYALPFKLNLVVAIAAAVAAGLLMERLPTRPAAPPPRADGTGDSSNAGSAIGPGARPHAQVAR